MRRRRVRGDARVPCGSGSVPALSRRSRGQPFVERRVDRLSGGQFQLLQVWACLGAPADLVVLDEPTTNMDPNSKAALEGILSTAHELVGGILVISHDHALLERVTSRIVTIGM